MNLRRPSVLVTLGWYAVVGTACDPTGNGANASGKTPGPAADDGKAPSPTADEPTTAGDDDDKPAQRPPLEAKVTAWDEAPQFAAPVGPGGTVRKLARGNEAFVAYLELDPGAQIPEHQDETEEFIHVLAGGGEMTIDGEQHEVRAGTTIYMPPLAKVSFANGNVPMRALQVFADPGPEKKYETWAPVKQLPLRHEKRCVALSEVYCPIPGDADPEREEDLGTVSFDRLSLAEQNAWHRDCREKLDTFDDEQLAQFDTCVGCVATCEDALDCLAGVDLCDP